MSELNQSLSHSKWDCKSHVVFHVVFVPKKRREAIFGPIRSQLGPILHALAKQKGWQIMEGHLMPDHVHMCIAIPPKHAVASVIGFLSVQQVVQQTKTRIFGGDTHAEGKILSLFEPSTEVIRKGKAGKPNEFGKMVKVQQAENQIVI